MYHLINFQRIAENKGTTFGHIKREDLHAARIKALDSGVIARLNRIFEPILSSLITNSSELHSLMNVRRVLLSNLSR
jgi:type I restriction enzyme S subunit